MAQFINFGSLDEKSKDLAFEYVQELVNDDDDKAMKVVQRLINHRKDTYGGEPSQEFYEVWTQYTNILRSQAGV